MSRIVVRDHIPLEVLPGSPPSGEMEEYLAAFGRSQRDTVNRAVVRMLMPDIDVGEGNVISLRQGMELLDGEVSEGHLQYSLKAFRPAWAPFLMKAGTILGLDAPVVRDLTFSADITYNKEGQVIPGVDLHLDAGVKSSVYLNAKSLNDFFSPHLVLRAIYVNEFPGFYVDPPADLKKAIIHQYGQVVGEMGGRRLVFDPSLEADMRERGWVKSFPERSVVFFENDSCLHSAFTGQFTKDTARMVVSMMLVCDAEYAYPFRPANDPEAMRLLNFPKR